MIRLNQTAGEILQLITGQNGATVTVGYSDKTTADFLGDSQRTSIVSAATTTICAAPAAGGVRNIDSITIVNTFAGSHTITIQITSSAVAYPIVQNLVLGVGERFEYTHANGCYVLTSAGVKKSGAAAAIDITNTPAGTISATTVQAALNELDTEKQAISEKDATGGYAGLTLFKINFKNVANTFTSFFTNSNTAARTYTFPNYDATIATIAGTETLTNKTLTSPAMTGATSDALTISKTATNATQVPSATSVISTATVTGSYANYASQLLSYGAIASGVTNTSSYRGQIISALRNYALGSDVGTLSALYGSSVSYGHYNFDASTPATTNVYGVYLQPYSLTGTITNLFDFYIATTSGGGTVTNRWGIYQVEANNNAFAGKARFGGLTAPVATVDVTGSIAASTTIATGGYTVATLPAGTVGQRAYVTDATAPTYLGALTGGGAVKCPVFYNSAAWVSA